MNYSLTFAFCFLANSYLVIGYYFARNQKQNIFIIRTRRSLNILYYEHWRGKRKYFYIY